MNSKRFCLAFPYGRTVTVALVALTLVALLVVPGRADIIYVVDHGNGTIVKFTADGVGSVFARGLNPAGIAVDKTGSVYVSNWGRTNSILKFTPDGVGSLFANTGSEPHWGLALDSKGNLYAANSSGSTVEKFTPDGVGTVFASGFYPAGIACDSADNVFVSSADGSIRKFAADGSSSTFVPSGQLDSGLGAAFDKAGNLYTTVYYYVTNVGTFGRVMKFTPDGTGSVFIDGLHGDNGLAFDGEGNLFVLDQLGHTVEKVTPDGSRSAFGDLSIDNPLFIAILPTVAPSVLGSPLSQSAEAGATVSLRIQAGGTAPTYFWYFNQTNLLSSSTISMLNLTNVQFVQSGAYAVVASNVLGAVTSAPAMLQVIAPVERRVVPGIRLTGQVGGMLNVDHAELLWPAPNWTALDSVPLHSSSQYYFDLTLPLPPERFYRVWQQVNPGVVPSLDVRRAAAITLTGNVGDSLRVDFINQVGPTDAWVTLDTVTLTNTSQSYFDVPEPGQASRLYRLVHIP